MARVRQNMSALSRWFKQFKKNNRPPYKWYEHDCYPV